jgi:hypothetical protein
MILAASGQFRDLSEGLKIVLVVALAAPFAFGGYIVMFRHGFKQFRERLQQEREFQKQIHSIR